jgi:hypothetical protein
MVPAVAVVPVALAATDLVMVWVVVADLELRGQ